MPTKNDFYRNQGAHLNPFNVDTTENSILKSPDLLNPTDIEFIKSMTKEESKKWKLLYSQADQY